MAANSGEAHASASNTPTPMRELHDGGAVGGGALVKCCYGLVSAKPLHSLSSTTTPSLSHFPYVSSIRLLPCKLFRDSQHGFEIAKR